jgi:hypothetical protein
MLVGDAMGHHLPRGYVYFAMGFSLAVEFINIRVRTRSRQGPGAVGPPEADRVDAVGLELDEPITHQPERKNWRRFGSTRGRQRPRRR